MMNFSKYHANGNDFMIVHVPSTTNPPSPQQVRRWANRHTGIGFDQLMWLSLSRNQKAPVELKVFNPDGSQSQQCGNGVCCVAGFLRDQDLCTADDIQLAIGKQTVFLRFLNDGLIAGYMGRPEFLADKIPYLGETCNGQVTFRIGEILYQAGLVNLGNPHAVMVVPNVKTAPLKKLGKTLQKKACFPEGVNVGCMQILSPAKINLRVFERGAGETLACGSGACAAVVIGRKRQLLDRQVRVIFPGGITEVSYPVASGGVEMTVKPVKIFSGKYCND